MADTTASDRPAEPADRAAVDRDVAAAGRDRAALEPLRAAYQARIARNPADFAATRGLTQVERTLASIGHGADPWDRSVRKLLR